MKRREFSLGLVAGLGPVAFPSWAQGGPVEGVNFIRLAKPAPVAVPAGKVEVVEFFWYGCPHCNALEPALEPWIKKLPADVVFRRVPVAFGAVHEAHQRLFYTLEAIGEQERLHRALFDAIHKDNLRITDESAMATWLGKQKVDVEKYKAAYRSFTVETKLKRALQMTQAYRMDGVPALAVQGRYVLTASMINDRQELLRATDIVIAEAIKRLPKK